MKVFIPITDEMMDQPDFAELLVPYQPGYRLLGELPASRSGEASVRTCPAANTPAAGSEHISPSSVRFGEASESS
jgi:hypothetical protein